MLVLASLMLSIIVTDFPTGQAGFGVFSSEDSIQFYLLKKDGDYSVSYTLLEPNVSTTRGWLLANSSNPFPLAVILHGMGGKFNASSNHLIGKALLENDYPLNLVSVDYSEELMGDYLKAVSRVRPVGRKVASCLDKLISEGVASADMVTLIGFSLGAHIAGIAGKIMQSNYNCTLGKIVALDPALPSFESAGQEERLYKNDADQVLVLHTTSGQVAFAEPLGNVDFYPNGGTDPQPMCAESKLTSLMCSHSASYRYLAESIEAGGFEAVQCDTWENYEQGKCKENSKTYMSINVNKSAAGKFYLKTRSKPPFGTDTMLADDEDQSVESVPALEHDDADASYVSVMKATAMHAICNRITVILAFVTLTFL